jgi:glucose/arabinose dehydrogenase
VTLVAKDLGNARFMAFDSNGTLYLSRPNEGDILMFRKKGDGYEQSGTFVEGYSKPHGMYFKDGFMWFTSDGKVNKTHITDGIKPAGDVQQVLTGLPQGGHWWRSILVTDDGFYTSIGGAGNITDDEADHQPDREKIWHYNLDGSGKELFVSGIRNTEKLWFRPGSDRIFGCDQGSDWMGQPYGDKQGFQPVTDYNPPEEFNEYVKGGFYGHPFIVGNRVPRLEFVGKRNDIAELAAKTIPPAWCLGPHWAADGWTFLNHSSMPKEFDRDAVIAFHGSWNRSTKAGYRIERVIFDKTLQIPIGDQMLVGTLGANGQVYGRPVDVVQAPDGSLLFSDDEGLPNTHNGRIYRIEYTGK